MSMLRDPKAVALATGTNSVNVKTALPLLINALQAQGILDPATMIAMLATVAVECSFMPITERGSRTYCAQYDGRKDLGNVNAGDGYTFRGRGYIQLTGRHNYRVYGEALGIDLEHNPDLALDPAVAAQVAALYFKWRHIPAAAQVGNWKLVREKVNGGLKGWPRFSACVNALTPLSKQEQH